MTEVLDWKTSRKSKENWESVRVIWIRLFSHKPQKMCAKVPVIDLLQLNVHNGCF